MNQVISDQETSQQETSKKQTSQQKTLHQITNDQLPKGWLISILLLSKFIERFAYFGWRSILFVFLVENVASTNSLNQEDITKIYAVVIVGTILMSLLGGFIGDKLNNNGRVAMTGFFLVSAGFAMTWQFTQDLYFVPIIIVSIGIGLASPNLTAMVGKLYFDQQHHLLRAYAANSLAINIGAVLSAMIIGVASQTIGQIGAILILSVVVLVPALLLHVFREKLATIDTRYLKESKSTRSILPSLSLLFIIVIAVNVLDELFWRGSIQSLMSNSLNADLANLQNFALIVTINCLIVLLFFGLKSLRSWKIFFLSTAVMTIGLMLWQQSFQLYDQLGYGQVFAFVLIVGILEAISQPYFHALLIKFSVRFIATSVALIALVGQIGQALIKVIQPESLLITILAITLIIATSFSCYYLLRRLNATEESQ